MLIAGGADGGADSGNQLRKLGALVGMVIAVRLVDQIVSGDGGITLEMPGQGGPEVDGALLVDVVVPEVILPRFTGVVLPALPAGGAVQVEDDIHVRRIGQLHGVVEPGECVGPKRVGGLIFLQQPIVERHAHHVEAERFDQLEITRPDVTIAIKLQEMIEALLSEPLLQCAEELGLVVIVLPFVLDAAAEHP